MHLRFLFRFLLPILLLVLLSAASPANLCVAEDSSPILRVARENLLQRAVVRFEASGTGDATATLKNNALITSADSASLADSKSFNASHDSSSCVKKESCCTQKSDKAAALLESRDEPEAECCVACDCNLQDAPPLPQNIPYDLPPSSTSTKGLAPQTTWALAVQEGFQRNLAALYVGRDSCSAVFYRTHGITAVQPVELTVLHCALQI